MQEKSSGLQLVEPPSPETLLPSHSLAWWWAAAVLTTIALAALCVFIRRRRARHAAPDPRLAAYQEAATALADAAATDARDAAVRCSLILRRYLVTATGDPALFETHEEFVARHDSLASLTPDARTAVSDAFSRLAALKYSPHQPAADPAAILADARQLLETLHRARTA
jgi:hypothetical protein